MAIKLEGASDGLKEVGGFGGRWEQGGGFKAAKVCVIESDGRNVGLHDKF